MSKENDYIMERIHEYGISCVNLHIRNRDGFGNLTDERKHQQAVFCAIRDMIENERDIAKNDSDDNYWQGVRYGLHSEGYAAPHIERIIRNLKAKEKTNEQV